MRRVLIAVAVLLTVGSPAFGGYIIIRVLLEGAVGGGATPPGPGSYGPGTYNIGSGKPGGPGGPKQGSGLGPPGGIMTPPMPGSGTGGMPMGAGATAPAGDFDHTRSVVVLIPLETDKLVPGRLDMTKPFNKERNPEFRKLVLYHHGKKLTGNLFIDSSSIQLYEELFAQPGLRKTRYTEMRDKYQQWLRGKTDPQLLYDALVLALEAGFIREPGRDGTPPRDAMSFAQELLDVAAEKKLTLPNDVQRFVTAWGAMSDAVKKPAPLPSDAENWRSRLDAARTQIDRHYALLTWDTPDAEIQRRGTQLNDNFAAFFLWHATRGVVLPVPQKPLLAVLAKDSRDHLSQMRLALDCQPSTADAFYSPDHNIVVLSPDRMDDVGRTFFRQSQLAFSRGLTRDRLLAGEIPKTDPTGEKDSKPEDVARATTIALVEKLVTEESEVAAVSREGSRQLLFSTGVLPKHVTLPNWLTEGAVSYFTRPRGPAYVTVGDDDKPFMTVSFTNGYGVANYVLQRSLRDLDTHKELNANRAKLLEHVLTDAYFSGLKDAVDPDPAPPAKPSKKPAATVGFPPMPGGPMPGGPMPPGVGSSLGPPPGVGSSLGPRPEGPAGMAGMAAGGQVDPDDPVILQRKKRERLLTKSQATAWALYYYLARARPAELKQYLAELNKLPRDLPIDGQTAYNAFVRVFKLSATPDGPADPALMQKFARDWLDYMNTVPTTGIDIPLVVPAPPKNTGPMGSMGPGSLGPMPPGGGGSPIP